MENTQQILDALKALQEAVTASKTSKTAKAQKATPKTLLEAAKAIVANWGSRIDTYQEVVDVPNVLDGKTLHFSATVQGEKRFYVAWRRATGAKKGYFAHMRLS